MNAPVLFDCVVVVVCVVVEIVAHGTDRPGFDFKNEGFPGLFVVGRAVYLRPQTNVVVQLHESVVVVRNLNYPELPFPGANHKTLLGPGGLVSAKYV